MGKRNAHGQESTDRGYVLACTAEWCLEQA
jgi:hypothetical protein